MYKNINKDVVVLSLKPNYAHSIISGKKRAEFRRNGVPLNIKYIVIYSTRPDQKIIGYCEVKSCVVASPKALWLKYGAKGIIERKDYFLYYEGVSKGKCYILKNPRILTRPIPLRECWSFSKAPQSFTYLHKKEWRRLRRKKCRVMK